MGRRSSHLPLEPQGVLTTPPARQAGPRSQVSPPGLSHQGGPRRGFLLAPCSPEPRGTDTQLAQNHIHHTELFAPRELCQLNSRVSDEEMGSHLPSGRW